MPDGLFLEAVYSEIKADSNIIYRTAVDYLNDSVDLHLTIYYPEEQLKYKKPLLLLFPPGGFYSSNVNNENITGLAIEYAGFGYITAAVEYRSGLDSPVTALSYEKAIYRATQDAKTAIRFLKSVASVYCIDTNFVFVGGTSAGSVIALHCAYLNQNEVSDSINASVEGTLETSEYAGNSSACKAVLNISGAILDKKIMQGESEPIISFHNTMDNQVYFHSGIYKNILPIFGSQVIDSIALANGITHQLKPFIQTGHGFKFNSPEMDTTIKMSSEFFYSLIKNQLLHQVCTDNLMFSVFPVPSSTYLYLKNDNNFSIPEIKFEIDDSEGKKILAGYLSDINSASISEINCSKLAAGVYILRLEIVYHQLIFKFIKQ